jgi:hypothetical protein
LAPHASDPSATMTRRVRRIVRSIILLEVAGQKLIRDRRSRP